MKFRATVLCVSFVLLGAGIMGAAVFAADEGMNIQDRVTELFGRWLRGDKAARAGVETETIELGNAAVHELYARLARGSFDFVGTPPGVAFSERTTPPSFDSMIQIECRFIHPAKDVKLPARPAIVDAKLADGGEQISGPRLTVYDGQRANVSVMRQQKYVRTFTEGEAVQGTVRTGLTMELRASVVGAKISCELRIVRADLDGEIELIQSGTGKIGAPSVIKREFAVTLLLDPNETITLALPGADPVLVQLTATPVKR